MSVKTSAFGAAGTTLGYKIGGASVYTPVAQLVEMDEDGIKIDAIETTLLAGTIKTYIPSIPDPGTISFTIYNVPGDAGVAELRTLVNTPQVVAWQIQYPDGTSPTTGSTEQFSGFLTGFAAKGFKIGETPTAEITMQVSGLIVLTPGS